MDCRSEESICRKVLTERKRMMEKYDCIIYNSLAKGVQGEERNRNHNGNDHKRQESDL